jgi:hypothetical protein
MLYDAMVDNIQKLMFVPTERLTYLFVSLLSTVIEDIM